MIGNKMNITAGDDSTNIQAKSVTISYGISFVDAREIALQTFKENFYELSAVAKKVAIERAEELVNKFLERLEKESPSTISKIEDPDVQYSVINAQKQYARNGEEHTLNLLVNLLSDRFQSKECSLRSIVLNESIEVMSKLTLSQIKAMTLIFLTKLTRFNNMDDDMDKIFQYYTKIIKGNEINTELTFYEHMVYTGVALSDVTMKNGQNLEYLLWQTYGLGGRKDNPLHLNDFEKKLNSFSEKEPIIKFWNSSFIKNFTLTSVGIAISVAYLNILFDTNIDLKTWISE